MSIYSFKGEKTKEYASQCTNVITKRAMRVIDQFNYVRINIYTNLSIISFSPHNVIFFILFALYLKGVPKIKTTCIA